MYREHAPAQDLAVLIDCFWTHDNQEPNPEYRVLPDGCIDIVFSTSGQLEVVGTMTTRRIFALPAHTSTVGVRFRPGAAAVLLQARVSDFTDRSVALEDVWGAEGANLRRRLDSSPPGDQPLRIVQECIEQRVSQSKLEFGSVLNACNAIAGRPMDVDELVTLAGVSPRHLRRLFLDQTGLSPKRLCRVLRFQRVIRKLEHGPPRSWADLALDCGYYDQAHMINEFREFSGVTPAEYFGRFFQSPETRIA